MDDPFTPEAGKDFVHIERDGTRIGKYQCMFSRPKLTLFYSEADICEGDKLIRAVPGRDETYTVEMVDYHQGFDADIPNFYTVEITKDTAMRKPMHSTTTNHFNISGSTGIQIGDNNVQHLQAAMKQVLASIEAADATPAEKEEARSMLNSFLSHPLVAAAVGAGLPAALGLFS